jgi:hypothetical protein
MFDFVFSEVFFFGLRENSARLQAPGGHPRDYPTGF